MNCNKNAVDDYQSAKNISKYMLEVSLLGGRGIAVVGDHRARVNGEKINYTDAESNQRTHPAHSCKQNTMTTTPLGCTITVPLNNI